MGAPAMLTKWIPEDDLLLKNAVEAGASLESLAKGAVQFSCRYSLREVQERWRSLLYDSDTSAEASAHIVEIEMEVGGSNPPKTNRICSSKGKESMSRGHKGDSVRSRYNAMRKRIRSEPCPADVGFLVPPSSHAGTGSDSGSADHLNLHGDHLTENFTYKASLSNDYGHVETGYGNGHHSFSGMVRVDPAAAIGSATHPAFQAEHVGEHELPDEMAGRNSAYTENISSSPVDEAGCNNVDPHFERNYAPKEYQHILGENLVSLEVSDVREIRPPNALVASNPYENDDIGPKLLSDFDSTNDNHGNLCSNFVENRNLSSQAPACNDSFHQLGYSSPQSGLPIWRTIEDFSTPTMPIDGHYGGTNHVMDDVKKMDAPGCDGATSEPKFDEGICGTELNNQTNFSENDFMDLSDTYMDFSAEALLFIDEDEDDVTDGPCLDGFSSIFLDSPSRTHEDVDNSGDPRTTEVLKEDLVISDAACSGESSVPSHQILSVPDNDGSASVSGICMPSASPKTLHRAEPVKEFMICVLSTEHLDIPDNDDVVLPNEKFPPSASSYLEQKSREFAFISSANVLSPDGRATVGDLTNVKEEQGAVALPSASSLKSGSLVLPKVGSLHSFNGCAAEAESSESDSIAGDSGNAGIAVDKPIPCTSETAAFNTAGIASSKEENTSLGFQIDGGSDAPYDSLLENQFEGSDHAKTCPLSIADSCKQEADMEAALQMCLPSNADLVSTEMGLSDSVAIMSTSDQEEQFSDSDIDVPNFADIEAMILDMDLCSYDQESSPFTKEVSRYQRADTKKAIVRLEQGAHAYMNRAISSHGAFAVFYGHHLKYFIRDPEVTLGRATEDVKVDIDLGKEGRANKISRRQAIIKMDDDGSFSLKNTGKFSIFVNSKEVPAKKRIHLYSGSLVEIKDMSFIFKVYEDAVRHYINSLRGSSQDLQTRFDWKPDQNP